MTASSGSADWALLFDCDGVIVETEELHRLAYCGAFEAFGLQIDGEPVVWDPSYYDVLQNTVGGGKPKMKYHFTQTCGGKWPTRTGDLGNFPPPDTEEAQMALIDDLQDKKTEMYVCRMKRNASFHRSHFLAIFKCILADKTSPS